MIIGAPISITKEMIERFGISFVVNGVATGHSDPEVNHEEERFTIAKEMNVYKEIDSKSDMTTEKIIDRIIENR